MMLRGIEFRALGCFVVLAEELHFRRAAERLNMAQPSLTPAASASKSRAVQHDR
jgi:DNA-binding transcriptional LysR family regulator